MYCENCGARIDRDSKFCENCGALINWDDAEPEFSDETEEMQPVTDINDLMGMDMEPDFEKAWPDSEKTMVFVKPEGTLQETQRFEYIPKASQPPEEGREPEIKEKQAPEPSVSEAEQAEPEKDPEKLGQEPEEVKAAGEKDLEPIEPEGPEKAEQESREEEPVLSDPDDKAQEETFSRKLSSLLLRKKETDEEQPEQDEELPEQEERQTISEPYEPKQEQEHQLFCMACGKRLPEGAAFCDACGTPTGEVAPVEIRKRRNGQSLILELIKGFFVRPASVIEKAASEDAFAAGIGFFVVKDVILAVLSAILMNRLIASLGVQGSWIASGDPFGFGAKIFLCGIILDALWIGILYGAGRLFRLGGSVRALAGAAGTAGLFPSVLLIITVILAAFVPAAAVCAAMITGAAGLIFMVKAVSASFKASENVILYMTAAVAACYTVILYLAVRLMI